ncbi:hypothetical protein EZV62_007201 [Acer yangbiense]|uniref:Uncharacterized protein n=1 Tax=Acer yangbiense TaxID=1000413 RepID=A0A5C7IBX1_9ROSI|nr:hypothetical protein EZV62_007201 [Acer yangbiense]
MTLRVRKPSAEIVLDDQEEDVSLSKIRQRRWRMAFRAIYFTRVLVSLTRKVLDHNNRLLRHSLSYVAIDLNPGSVPLETQSFPEADKKVISEMVKEKKFESLSELGGVKQVLQVLKSDPKSGVSDNEYLSS